MSRKSPDSLSERDRRELAALADGSLTGRRRRAAEERIAGSPELRAGLERQRRAVAALTGAEVAVPASLRARVRGAIEEPPKGRTPWLAWAGGAAVAIAAVMVVTLIIAGGAETPTVGEAAQLSALSPTEPAPAPAAGEPALLTATAEGLSYPNWRGEFGWRAAGERADELGDRSATTVYYDKDGRRLGYTIVSGEPLAPPAGADSRTIDGVEFMIAREGERTTVTWLRGGHSCVLSGEGIDERTMVELAAWKGEGAVAF